MIYQPRIVDDLNLATRFKGLSQKTGRYVSVLQKQAIDIGLKELEKKAEETK